jgi:acetoacetyl-CoA synthetase
MSNPIWKPDQKRIEISNISKFQTEIETKHNLKFNNYNELHQWSIDNPDKFWSDVWEYSNVIYSKNYNKVLGDYPESDYKIPRPAWFEGSELNFAENLLRNRGSKTAITAYSEQNEKENISYDELYSITAKLAHNLKLMG